MEITELETQLRKRCREAMTSRELQCVERLKFQSYDAETKTLVLGAKDSMEALFASAHCSHTLIALLEELVGAPAQVICRYVPMQKPHERFHVEQEYDAFSAPAKEQRTSASRQRSRLDELEERVAALEKKFGPV